MDPTLYVFHDISTTYNEHKLVFALFLVFEEAVYIINKPRGSCPLDDHNKQVQRTLDEQAR